MRITHTSFDTMHRMGYSTVFNGYFCFFQGYQSLAVGWGAVLGLGIVAAVRCTAWYSSVVQGVAVTHDDAEVAHSQDAKAKL